MHINHQPRALALASLFCLATLPALAQAEAINGAIYTSDAAGNVNVNLYESKSAVYLNGGPPANAPCSAGGMDDGNYYFQVTPPDGSSSLHKADDGVAQREFVVSGGVIVEYLGSNRSELPGTCPGSISIALAPFNDTDNNGGVYKVWVTRKSDFDAACGGSDCGTAGFVPGSIKTDNFKVEDDDDEEFDFFGSVQAIKFYDADASGSYNAGIDILLEGWKMTLESFENAVFDTDFTAADGSVTWDGLVEGIDYTVEEGIPNESNWVHSATIYGDDGDEAFGPVENPAGPLTVKAGETTVVKFGNYCTVPSNGRTLGFWSNRNGQALIDAGDLETLVALNLRNANGTDFNPANNAAFRTWLLNGTATNMAYMLSVQMAAMKLNVDNGFVNGGGTYVPAGMTVNQLIAAANASLGSDGLTLAGHPQRAYQEQLKDWLDELNNGAGLLSPTPCAYSFP